MSEPSSSSIVAGQTVTVTGTITAKVAGLRQGSVTIVGYDWETPTQQGPLPLTTPPARFETGPVPEGETRTNAWALAPTTNTRYSGRFDYQTTCGLYGHGVLPGHTIDVAPRLTLTAVRDAPRLYTFSGVATTPGLVLNLYRVSADGSRVLTSQARVTDAQRWSVTRRFSGSGRFGFVVRSGRNMANAPGVSNVRPTLIY
jgi:hypothetical protein